MKLKNLTVAAAVAVASMTTAGVAHARDQIQIVGSSTVFPFATAVAERFGQTSGFKAPVVESTGSGGGLKLFCAGVGAQHPDIANASRRIKDSEFKTCTDNGVTMTEVKIGFDGIVLANSKAGPDFFLTKEQIFLALAKEVPVDGKLVPNPYKSWKDVDATLPDEKIEVLGPPPTSGTRDAFVELAMQEGAKEVAFLAALRKEDKDKFEEVASTIREDGAYIEAGENDNLIVQKLEANPEAVGIFGFSFLDQNADKIKAAIVDGKSATFDNIANGDYQLSRSLFFYVKKEHVGVIPGLKEYVAEFTSDKAFGDEGYLVDKGLIPLPQAEREKVQQEANKMATLSM